MKSPIPTVLAVVLPLVVLAAGAVAVGDYEPPRPAGAERELANAGRVMNGRRLNKSVVEQMEAELDRKEPRVLIIGNSYANTNIDPKRIARAMDIPAKKVKVLSVPNSVGSHWYALLKNRVYANGHRPDIVIVVSPLQSMLLTVPYSEASYTNLTVQLDDTEPLIDRLVPRSSILWRRLRQRRGAVRDGILASVRDGAIGLFYPSATLQEDNEDALERVFHDANIDMERYGNALPVVETRDHQETGATAVPHPSESMLPHLAELASANGSKLVFVRSPMAPRTPEAELDAVPEGWQQATHALLAQSGHVLADLSTLPMQDALFHNPGHMSDEGSRLFTKALIAVMRGVPLRGRKIPVQYELLGQLELQDGLLVRELPETHYDAPPPPIEPADRPVSPSRRRAVLGALDADDLDAISDARTMKLSELSARCSPVRVAEDGVELAHHHEACSEVRFPVGRVCHGPKKRIVVMSSDGQPVDDHAYSLSLDPERACLGGRWLYPGDRLTLSIGPEVLARFPTGAEALTLSAVGFDGEADLTLELIGAPDAPPLQAQLLAAKGTSGSVSLGLTGVFEPGAAAARLVVKNDGDTFVLLTSALLAGPPN